MGKSFYNSLDLEYINLVNLQVKNDSTYLRSVISDRNGNTHCDVRSFSIRASLAYALQGAGFSFPGVKPAVFFVKYMTLNWLYPVLLLTAVHELI